MGSFQKRDVGADSGKLVMEVLSQLFRPFAGILAADERPASLEKRLSAFGIAPTKENAMRYRELLFSTPNLERTITGVILAEDTFLEHSTEGVATPEYLRRKGIVVGVKVDEGLVPYEGSETLFRTEGLALLEEKCARYAKEGAGFVKWRSVIPAVDAPDAFIATIAQDLAQYASVAVRHGLVPIIEPEIALAGSFSADAVAETLSRVLHAVLSALRQVGCSPHSTILKTSFVTSGLQGAPENPETVAQNTLSVFHRVGLDSQKGFFGIVFLSGGLASSDALHYIQRIKAFAEQEGQPHTFSRPLTFSYGRALQEPFLTEWGGDETKALQAQIAFTQVLQHAIKTYRGPEQAARAGSGIV